jgi:heme-degrading monooxygenase HmoA
MELPGAGTCRRRGSLLGIRCIPSLVARIWRTRLDRSRAGEYDEFARTRSQPMFERHDGFHGVLFATAGDERVVITLWRDRAAAAALEQSGDYRATVRAIEAAGFLRPPQRVELLAVQGARVDALDR